MNALLALSLALPVAAAPVQEKTYQNRVTPVVQVVRSSRPAVVYIRSNVPSQPRRDFWGRTFKFPDQESSGSGVLIYDDGYIVTNFHVVRGANRIQVNFDQADDSRVYEAQLISSVPSEDLALIKIEREGPFPTVPLSSEDPILGETVVAIGNPYGQTHTVSTGIISGLHRDIQASGMRFTNLIQTDASINPGNSGGPLLNINGELIGINTAMNTQAENIGFAIPVDRIRKVLVEYLSEANSWLGFDIELAGMSVAQVVAGGPAAEAGMQVGDLVLAIGDRRIKTDEDYNVARLSIEAGDDVAVRIRQGRKERTVSIKAWNRLDGLLHQRLGMTVERTVLGRDYTPYLRVAQVDSEGPAGTVGLAAGDVIAAVRPEGKRSKALQRKEDLAWLVSRLQPGEKLEFEVWRDEDEDGVFELTVDYSELFEGTLELR